jgi:uncharacterized membrane protein YraQ (UPF0718 family)
MAIPVYVVTGFLDAGKSSFMNNLLGRSDWRDAKMLVLQFETGEAEFHIKHHNCEISRFSKRELERQPDKIIRQIAKTIQSREFDEIWIEWNGVVPFSQLQAMLLDNSLRGLCKIQKVLHIADAANIENLLGRTGGALPEQIANSDLAVLRNPRSPADTKRIRRTLRGINPGIPIYGLDEYNDLYKQLFIRKERPVNFFFMVVLALIALHFLCAPLFERTQIPLNTVVNIFLGIILQAIPFLLIGVLLSSAIQVFVPQRVIERRFPKSVGLGMVVAIIGGFCLPVCDCASIPIFRSLVRKGIPLSAAVTFMTVSPVINPVVILSTYYAFSGNAKVVAARVGLGIVASIIIGLLFASRSAKKKYVLSGGALDRLMCSCGCYEDAESVTTFRGKAGLFIRHSQAEFFNVGKYLVIGTFIASIFQTLGTGAFTAAQSGAGLAASILIMMAMAFVLSLCSSSDAVIARSFAKQFPMGALMGFLVFGPMMDIKNMMMLSSGFTKRFICKLLAAASIVCFLVVFLFFKFGGIGL